MIKIRLSENEFFKALECVWFREWNNDYRRPIRDDLSILKDSYEGFLKEKGISLVRFYENSLSIIMIGWKDEDFTLFCLENKFDIRF